MDTTTRNPIARLLAPVGKLTLALFGAAAIGTTFAGDVAWKGTTGTFSTGANWSTEAYPTSSDTAQFMGASAGSTVTFDGTYAVGYIWVGEATNPALYIDDNGTATPVVFTASDPSYGMTTAGRFCCADGANQRGALTVNSGTYTTTAGGYWGWGDNVKFVANFNGGTVNINGSPDGSSNGLYMMYGNGVTNEINIAGGKLAVENDVVIGTGADATSSTTINISNGGELSCGTASTAKWFKMPADSTGKVTVNLNANGTLALWHIRHVSAGECAVNFNGGTLKVLGDIGYGLLGYDNNTDASTMSFTLGANGGTIDTDFNTSLNNPVSGTGGLTKKGSGTLTFSAMPTFNGAITVEAGAGSVILPSGATVAAGADTRTRATSAGVEYYYFSGSTYSSSTLFTAGDDATITLSGDAVLDVDDTKTIGKLTVTGSGVLSIAGSGAVTASSLQIDSGATVQLASGTTLADGRIVTTSVTGAGVIGYTGVNPDSSVGYDNSAVWTGTVWIQGLTGLVNWNPTAFGNSASTLRLSGVAGYFVNAQLSLPFAIELENDIYSYGIDLTNGYSFNSTGGWCYVKVPTLKGTGTYKTSGGGGNLFVVTDDWSGFTGSFSLANKTVWLGYGTPTAEVDLTPGTFSGGIRIAEGKSVNWSTSWTLSKFLGKGTIKMAAPWDATPAFGGYVGDSALWVGTVELAACVNEGTGSTCVYPDRMGNANSKIVFKGLAPGATKGYYLNGSTAATVQLDGPVTISDASSSARYEIGVLTGTSNFTGATSVGTACTFVFNAISNYTGTISANSKSLVTVGTYIGNTEVVVDQKLVGVDPNNANVSLNSVTVDGIEQTVATTLKEGDDGYGLYVAAMRRDVYWIGGASGNWGVASNWALADGTVLSSWPNDSTQYAGDNVIFTNVASVVVDKKVVVTKITLDADVTFSCDNLNGGVGLWFDLMEGEGKLLMSNLYIAIISSGSRHVTIMNDIEVVTGTSNAIQTGKSGLTHLYGDITGGGTLTLWTNGNNGGAAFHGDNSGFYGTFDTSASDSTRNDTSLFYGNASGANAFWKVKANSYSVQTASLIRDSGTYYFGALQGYVNVGDFTPTIVVGGRSDVDSSFSVTSRKDTKIVKTGSGLATQTASGAVGNGTFNTIYSHDIYGGMMVLDGIFPTDHISFLGVGATLKTPSYAGGDDRVYPDVSGLIKNSTSAICFDDAGEDFTWTSALAASNAGGLTKLGSGTLTLSVVPQYKGPTTVAAGKLVVPFGTKFESLTINGDGCVVVDMTGATARSIAFSSGTFIGDSSKVTLVNVPEGYTVQNLGSANNIIYGNGSVTYTWIGPTSDDYSWETDTNWSPTGVPGAIDEVIFQTATPGFTLASDTSVLAMTVNAAGFTYSADYALTVVDTLTVVSAGTVTITGSGSFEVNGEISGVNSVAMTPKAATEAIINAHPYYTEMFRASTDLELTSLSGAGTINSSADQSVTVAENETSTFYGSFTGSMGLTKSGEGTLELQGPNNFTGDIAIEAGTLAVSPYDYSSIMAYDFDASTSTEQEWVVDETTGAITRMRSKTPFDWYFKTYGTDPAYLKQDGEYFDGKPYIWFNGNSNQYRYESDYKGERGKLCWTTITVYQKSDTPSAAQVLHWYDDNSYIRLNGSMWQASKTGTNKSWALYTDGVHGGSFVAGKKSVMSFSSDYCGNANEGAYNRCDKIGRTFVGAVAEVIGFAKDQAASNKNTDAISIEQRAAIESYLMQKWGCDDAEDHQILPKTANVTMNAAATLDLGGMAQTVASFAGAGTITNGSLKTTGDLVATGSLTVQAVEGQTYTLSTDRRDVVTFTGAATGYFVQPQADAAAASRFAVPKGLTVGFDRDGDFDVTIINAPAKWTLKAYDGAETTTYRIGSHPFRLYLR